MRRTLILSTVALALGTAANAQNNCGPRDQVINRLSANFGEVFSGGGLQNDSAVFEVWISEDESTWTILMTRPDGMSCIMAAGTDWLPALASQQVKGVPS